MRLAGRLLVGLWFGWVSASVLAGFEDDFEAKKWEEVAVLLPSAPKKDSLVEFYVSPLVSHAFFVDLESISVGSDGVVRYTLVVRTDGGATNVSYEGIRCQTRERRAYAFGHADGSWSRSRGSEWTGIRESSSLRHHAALFTDYFCPNGVIVASAQAARVALQQARRQVSPAAGVYIGR